MNFKFGLAWVVLLCAFAARAQTTTFTYQGQLGASNSPATGNYDFRFRLLDVSNNIIAGPVTNAPVGVTNGLFTTTIDFGATAFNGSLRALELAVRAYGDTNAYTVLAPTQAITSTPYAIQSLNASNAVRLTSPLAATNLSGTIPDAQLSTNVALLTSNVTFRGSVTASNFTGNGSGLTGLTAPNLTGIVPDTALSTNVAFLNTNANFATNVTAVLFTGSGHGLTNVPGAFFWVTIAGTNATASSNIGFIVTNNTAPVIITLPSAPSVGDTFKVAGVGAGGWIIVQNSGQQILAGNLADTTGLNWTPQINSGLRTWTGLASSADGTKLFATTQGYIYISTNSGVTWTQEASSQNWSSVASSTDGSHLVATIGTSSLSGNLYTSTDGGNTWTSHSYSAQWAACASSANGNNLVAVATGGSGTAGIYISSNTGSTWTSVLGADYWSGVASSADGTKLVAVGAPSGGSYIYTSTNSGTSWLARTNSGLHIWSAVTSSADGNRLVATVNGGSIYTSADAGVTWTSQNLNSVAWTALTSSRDGSLLAAAYTGPGYIFTSDDSGSLWLQRFGAPNTSWTAITSSADGSKLAAAASGGYIYTSGQGATTTGTAGYLAGGYQSALELEYVGGGVFIPLNHEGTIRAY